MNDTFASNEAVGRMHIEGRTYGKRANDVPVENTRIVLPLLALANLADFILARRINKFVDAAWSFKPHTYVGAVPGTQCLDIAAAVQLGVEKMLDQHSAGWIAQADIARFYDSVSVIRVAKCAIGLGLDIPSDT